jgi:hypothetical protein
MGTVVIGRIVYDADGYAHVRVIRNGVGVTWCLTVHDVQRVEERATKREAPATLTARPSWRLRLAVWLYGLTRERT